MDVCCDCCDCEIPDFKILYLESGDEAVKHVRHPATGAWVPVAAMVGGIALSLEGDSPAQGEALVKRRVEPPAYPPILT